LRIRGPIGLTRANTRPLLDELTPPASAARHYVNGSAEVMHVENPENRRVHMSLQVVTCGVRRS
jgi:hypothetical protein